MACGRDVRSKLVRRKRMRAGVNEKAFRRRVLPQLHTIVTDAPPQWIGAMSANRLCFAHQNQGSCEAAGLAVNRRSESTV